MAKSLKEQIASDLLLQLTRSLRKKLPPGSDFQFIHNEVKQGITLNLEIAVLLQRIEQLIIDQSLSNSGLTYLSKNLNKLPMFAQLYECLEQLLLNDITCLRGTAPQLAELLAQDNEETLAYLIAIFAPKDNRTQIDDDRNLRRMDSLARLFALPLRLSVCTAVAVHDNKLIIALNLNGDDCREEVIQHIFARCRLLAQFINDNQHDQDAMVLASESFCDQLRTGGSSISKRTFTTALQKFTDAVCFDDETFDESLKQLFMSSDWSVELLLPALDGNTPLINVVKDFGASREFFPLNCDPCDAVKLIHAEQLLAWHILNQVSTTDTPLVFGVSKLCCETCRRNFESLAIPIKTRGTHGEQYARVLGIFARIPEVDKGSPPRVAMTGAIGSDEKSPQKRRARQRKESPSERAVCRQLFFDAGDNGDTAAAGPADVGMVLSGKCGL